MTAGRATLVYDGKCGFCRRWVDRVRRWDRHGRIDLLPYQAEDLDVRLPQLSREACRQRMHFVDESSAVFAGAAAGREVLRRFPAGRLWALPFGIPGALRVAEPIYVWITHRWGPLPRPGVPTSAGRPAIGSSTGACAARADRSPASPQGEHDDVA